MYNRIKFFKLILAQGSNTLPSTSKLKTVVKNVDDKIKSDFKEFLRSPEELLPLLSSFMKKNGYSNIKYLAKGMANIVFSATTGGKDVILKVTNSKSDIEANLKLKAIKQSLKSKPELARHIMEVYDIIDFHKDIKIIITERLKHFDLSNNVGITLKRILFGEERGQPTREQVTEHMSKMLRTSDPIANFDIYVNEKLSINIDYLIDRDFIMPVIKDVFSDCDISVPDNKWDEGKIFRSIYSTLFEMRKELISKSKNEKYKISSEDFQKEARKKAYIIIDKILSVLEIKVESEDESNLFNSLLKILLSSFTGNLMPERLEVGGKPKITALENLPETRSFARLLKYLESKGIKFRDMREMNIMVRPSDNSLVISDPGMFKFSN